MSDSRRSRAQPDPKWAIQAYHPMVSPLSLVWAVDAAAEKIVGRKTDFSGASSCMRDLGWYCKSNFEAHGLAAKLRAAFPEMKVKVRNHATKAEELADG